MAQRGTATKRVKQMIEMKRKALCARSDKELERVRFYLRNKEYVNLLDHCIKHEITMSEFVRDAVFSKMGDA